MKNSCTMTLEINQSQDFLNNLAWKYAKNHDDAKDLIQDTVCKALEKASYFKGGTNFRAWIAVVMRNIFINGYRKKKRQLVVPIENTFDLSDTYKIEPTAESNLITEEVSMALSKIDEKSQEVLKLCQEGYAYKDIADILKLPMGTVKSRIHHARKELKFELKKIHIM